MCRELCRRLEALQAVAAQVPLDGVLDGVGALEELSDSVTDEADLCDIRPLLD